MRNEYLEVNPPKENNNDTPPVIEAADLSITDIPEPAESPEKTEPELSITAPEDDTPTEAHPQTQPDIIPRPVAEYNFYPADAAIPNNGDDQENQLPDETQTNSDFTPEIKSPQAGGDVPDIPIKPPEAPNADGFKDDGEIDWNALEEDVRTIIGPEETVIVTDQIENIPPELIAVHGGYIEVPPDSGLIASTVADLVTSAEPGGYVIAANNGETVALVQFSDEAIEDRDDLTAFKAALESFGNFDRLTTEVTITAPSAGQDAPILENSASLSSNWEHSADPAGVHNNLGLIKETFERGFANVQVISDGEIQDVVNSPNDGGRSSITCYSRGSNFARNTVKDFGGQTNETVIPLTPAIENLNDNFAQRSTEQMPGSDTWISESQPGKRVASPDCSLDFKIDTDGDFIDPGVKATFTIDGSSFESTATINRKSGVLEIDSIPDVPDTKREGLDVATNIAERYVTLAESLDCAAVVMRGAQFKFGQAVSKLETETGQGLSTSLPDEDRYKRDYNESARKLGFYYDSTNKTWVKTLNENH